ncbi:MAG: hypothetical protein M3065_16540 [Actinomycetota bacterium]|nr:hypothetical protein [Actinomycetota bacterium]
MGDRADLLPASPGPAPRGDRLCSKESKEVPYNQVAKGYEVRTGRYVLLTQKEIDAAGGERST